MKSRYGIARILVISGFIIATVLLLVEGLYAQNSVSQTSYLSRPPFQPANLWMTNPVPWSPANDLVPGPIRQARDQYFDRLIGYRESLTPDKAKGAVISEGVSVPNQSEIPELPERAVVIATFTSYQPVLSESGRAIYTEATFTVGTTFEDKSGHASAGSSLVLIIPGGTVVANGVVLSYLTQPRQYFMSVGKTYLLALSYHASGAFFMSGKDWDVTNGVVVANFSSSPTAPRSLIGLSLQELVAKLDAQFRNN